jgi:nucleotide-binding universal stress UspA family protein
VEFNGFFEGRVTCLHVNRLDGDKGMRSAEKMAQLAQLAQDAGLQGVHFEVVEADTVEQGLFAFAHEANADLLVVRPQDHGVLGSIFHKSVSKQLSNHTNLPLLIMK